MSFTAVPGGWVNYSIELPKMELKCEEGRIFGARYYTVEPTFGSGKWFEMEEWCITAFGKVSNIWGTSADTWRDNKRWYMNNNKFWFRNEEDRNWFMLRWQ